MDMDADADTDMDVEREPETETKTAMVTVWVTGGQEGGQQLHYKPASCCVGLMQSLAHLDQLCLWRFQRLVE